MIEFHVAFANRESARELARAAVETRNAACANIVQPVESLFWWNGAVEKETEVLVIFKTSERCADALGAFIEARHPYETPAIIRHEHVSANADYERWVEEETHAA